MLGHGSAEEDVIRLRSLYNVQTSRLALLAAELEQQVAAKQASWQHISSMQAEVAQRDKIITFLQAAAEGNARRGEGSLTPT